MKMAAGLIALGLFSVIVSSFGRNVTVTTYIGTIVGKTVKVSFARIPLQVTRFLGIPFAEPPVGQRRFQKPVRKAEFTEIFHADTMSPMCFQHLEYYKNLAHTNITPDQINESEDCLYLNVYLPGGSDVDVTNKRKVMIWIYGGGFQFGAQNFYNALSFVGLNDVILVTFNYRLSVFGFLSSGDNKIPGNYGLWDQHMAIKWVHDNIEHFGGDTTNITIFGESAGAASVIYQALYDGNNGLFQRVIAESGTVDYEIGFTQSLKNTFSNFASKFGCRNLDPSLTASCLRNVSYSEFTILTKHDDIFYPVLDRDFIKENPADIMSGKTNAGLVMLNAFGKLDLILGVNSAEGAANVDLVEGAIRSKGKDPANGYTVEMFQNIIVPTMLSNEKVSQTDVVIRAIVNQYVNWSSPKDKQIMRLRAIDFMSDIMFNADVVRTADAHASVNETGRLYFYVYDHKFSLLPDRWYPGANHGEEVALVLGFPENYDNGTTHDPAAQLPPSELLLSKQIMEYWTNFAKTGSVFPAS